MEENLMYKYSINSVSIAQTQIMQTGDQKTGAQSLLPYKKIWFDDDEVEVPYISANSIRGKLRRKVMRSFCNSLGYTFEEPHVWHSFFGGGQLKSGSHQAFDAGLRRRIMELIPAISLWGMSYGNQAIQGKLIVCDMDVLCSEMKEYIIPAHKEYCKDSFHRFTSSLFFTRKDDNNDGSIKTEDEQAIQMKVEIQVLIPGTRFSHTFMIRDHPTDIEISCLHHALKIWNEMPFVGGKSATGYGQLQIEFSENLDDSLYLDFLKEKRDKIIVFLDNLQEEYKKFSKK